MDVVLWLCDVECQNLIESAFQEIFVQIALDCNIVHEDAWQNRKCRFQFFWQVAEFWVPENYPFHVLLFVGRSIEFDVGGVGLNGNLLHQTDATGVVVTVEGDWEGFRDVEKQEQQQSKI